MRGEVTTLGVSSSSSTLHSVVAVSEFLKKKENTIGCVCEVVVGTFGIGVSRDASKKRALRQPSTVTTQQPQKKG